MQSAASLRLESSPPSKAYQTLHIRYARAICKIKVSQMLSRERVARVAQKQKRSLQCFQIVEKGVYNESLIANRNSLCSIREVNHHHTRDSIVCDRTLGSGKILKPTAKTTLSNPDSLLWEVPNLRRKRRGGGASSGKGGFGRP
jgi:hypothetical protein